jgi:hypothetical protein
MKSVWLAIACVGVSVSSSAQVPVVISPGIVGEPAEAIGLVTDANLPGTGALKKLFTVPAGRVFRLTDLSLTTRRADTGPSPCIVEILRGTEAGPTTLAWSRVKILDNETYDRSWQSPPTFAAGEVVWLRAFFDPFNTNLRLCVRANVNTESEIVYGLRGI